MNGKQISRRHTQSKRFALSSNHHHVEFTIEYISIRKYSSFFRASQHGTDLVVPLSNILNRCANRKNDMAASLALDAIILLCNSNTVNIASTWSAVKNIFRSNRQHRTVKRCADNVEIRISIIIFSFHNFSASANFSVLFHC